MVLSNEGKNMMISGPLIQEKAREVAAMAKMSYVSASNGWLDKFRIRHAIRYKAICGESKSFDKGVVDDWKEKLKFNIDENLETETSFVNLSDLMPSIETEEGEDRDTHEDLNVVSSVDVGKRFKKLRQ